MELVRKRLLMIIALVFVVTFMIISYTSLDSFSGYLQKQRPSLLFPNNNLKVQVLAEKLSSPTSMVFVDNNNILVLERSGKVRLISDGILHNEPVLTLPVDTQGERGLLGIATVKTTANNNNNAFAEDNATKPSDLNRKEQESNFIFLYFTESKDGEPLRNRIYKYQWNGHGLVNQDLILDLPAMPGPYHDGGKLAIGPDNCLYAVIGDLNSVAGPLQNYKTNVEEEHNDTSVILRIPLENISYNILPSFINSFEDNENRAISQYYYAYGIRNSFGLAFDPITGILWDTENGEDKYDEINLVKPGFNSGWYKAMGPISRTNVTENDLVNFYGSQYSDPLFSWYIPIGITDIEFLKSNRLGDKYANNIFVGDINNGKLYYFEVNENRTGLKFNENGHKGTLKDSVADNDSEISRITFGDGFGRITDLETGPDGFLYILSYEPGIVYRIVA
jgi:glucose/arabinose dehydrogenase